ncbi:DUF6924 domain-containing protein [Streptomyces spinosirectus]
MVRLLREHGPLTRSELGTLCGLSRTTLYDAVGALMVDERGYAGASPDEVVLSALAADPRLEVVFLADAATMTGDHSLLAVSTRPEELEEGDEELGCEFRLIPTLVNTVHVNLAIGHLDFWEFAYGAARIPDNVLRF